MFNKTCLLSAFSQRLLVAFCAHLQLRPAGKLLRRHISMAMNALHLQFLCVSVVVKLNRLAYIPPSQSQESWEHKESGDQERRRKNDSS